MTNALDTTAFDMAGVSRRQLNLFLLLDCSGSMIGEKMASLNHAIASSLPAIRSAAADNPETDVRLAVMRFSDMPTWQTPAPVPVNDYQWTDLAADGETRLGTALGQLALMLTPEALPGRQLAPIIVLVSDGQPTDDFAQGLDALLSSPYGARSIRVAVAIGSDADLEVLKAFIAHPEFRVLQAHDAEQLVNRIRWATTAPVKASIAPGKIGETPMQSLAKQTVDPSADMSDLVW